MELPALFTALRTYSRGQAAQDVTAGVIVGIVALPLAIAFAIASGLPPAYGLYTAIVAGFLISALGGSNVQIGGPTGAFIIIVYGIVQQHGIPGLTLATIMAGVILVIMGLAGFGAAIKFIPFPVVTGFTAGIALVILSSQVGDFFGLRMESVPAHFFEKWAAFARAMDTFNPDAVGLALASVLIIALWPRVTRRFPGPFVAITLSMIAVPALGLHVETIGSRFGALDISFPVPHVPEMSFASTRALIAPALAIAMLGAIESLLSAVIADGMIGGRHRSNVELVGQGVANIAAPLFGGMPATGAIARTATNVRNGGRTPVAGIVHAITLLVITVFFGDLAAQIPLATLAAILVVVAYHMSEWRSFRSELSGPRSDVAVLLVTFTLTVAFDLVIAIQAGMVLAAFLFMKRMSDVTNVSVITRELNDAEAAERAEVVSRVPAGVEVYAIDGPFFFGAAEKFKETLAILEDPPRVLIIRLQRVPAIDSTALHALRSLLRRARGQGTRVLIAETHSQPLTALERSGLLDEIGEDNMCGTIDDALEMARAQIAVPADAA